MKALSILFFLFISLMGYCQKDTTFFFGINGRIADAEGYEMKKVVSVSSPKKIIIQTIRNENGQEKRVSTEFYQKSGENTFQVKLKEESGFTATYTRRYKPLDGGTFEFADLVDGKIKRQGTSLTLFPLLFDGTVTEFYNNGHKLSESVYEGNELASNKNWLEGGTEYFDNIFYSADKLPAFKSGNGSFHQHVLKIFKDSQVEISKISGNMVVGFIVFENGSIGGFKIVKGINPQLNALAIQSLMTLGGEWEPAQLDGRTVRYFQLFPINFISREAEFHSLEFDGTSLQWETN